MSYSLGYSIFAEYDFYKIKPLKINKKGSIENNKDDVNTPEFKIKHLVIVLTKLKLPVQTTLDIPKRRREENDLDTLIYIPKDHIKSLPNLDISSITFNKNDDSQQNEHTKSLINIENQNFNDELDTISNNLPPTSENQNFNDELDTISNNLPLTSEIPRYSIKNYDKNKLNTLDHFKSLPSKSISSIILKKNDSSQQNIIGCINLEFKGISQLIFTPRGKKNSDNKQKNTLSHNKSLSNKYISKKSRENLNGNEVPLMSATHILQKPKG
ncbi:probable basic-leucine zipper transcription factor S [Gordionus sp. m RMFG-2023]|uniref:probable basic-leucine zipper transcription factor S n=1 Tax=Gordionus sp. m RMFG-2023 TaxID=3053472 RepID=UPI0031FCC360